MLTAVRMAVRRVGCKRKRGVSPLSDAPLLGLAIHAAAAASSCAAMRAHTATETRNVYHATFWCIARRSRTWESSFQLSNALEARSGQETEAQLTAACSRASGKVFRRYPCSILSNEYLRVRFQIIDNAHIKNVGNSQSCMDF